MRNHPWTSVVAVALGLVVSAAIAGLAAAGSSSPRTAPAVTLTKVADVPSLDGGALAFLGKLFFVGRAPGGDEALYSSDGSSATDVFDFSDSPTGTPPGDPDDLFSTGTKLFFNTDSQTIGTEPWVSDGTTGGTHLVKDVNPGSDRSGDTGQDSAAIKKKLFWAADDGVHGEEPWVTDGTSKGTKLLEIRKGADGSVPDTFTTWGSKVWFEADDGVHGYEFWTTSGSKPKLFKDLVPGSDDGSPTEFHPVSKKQMFFDANAPATGYELYVTNGTSKGTKLVTDINPGSASSNPGNGVVFDGRLFFRATDGTHGSELWVSDGTAAGTQLIDVVAGSAGSSPSDLTPCGGKLFFVANGASGGDVYVTDGTTPGTLAMGVAGGVQGPGNLACLDGVLVFANWDGVHGDEFWASDGTPAGTAMVQDIDSGAADSQPIELTLVGDTVFFFATDGAPDDELWKATSAP